MKLSGFKDPLKQQTFWDTPLGNHGHIRTVIGEFVEELTARLLNGQRHRTTSTVDYCPDVSVVVPGLGRVYFECKAAGRNRETFIYSGRLEKDRKFIRQHPLAYAIWHHTTDTKQANTVEDLQALFLSRLQSVYIVPFLLLDDICRDQEPTPLNSAYGHSDTNPTYGSGFRIRLKDLEPWKQFEWDVTSKDD